MGSKREHLRVNSDSPCILSYEGVNYRALLENISLGGALVNVGSEQLRGLCIGASVDLMLCDNPDSCPTRYSCEVIRRGSSDIGINFKKLVK